MSSIFGIVSTRWYTHAHTPGSENAFVHAEFLSAANQNHVGEFAVIQSRREIRKKVFIDGRNRQIGRGSRLRVRFLGGGDGGKEGWLDGRMEA